MSADSKRKQRDGKREKRETDGSVRQAIERAAHHAGLALAEGVASARALLDAASIGMSGESAQTHPHLSEFAQALDQMTEALSGATSSPNNAALSALLEALDAEISRWDVRSRADDDARAVLRAFLGLREFLWELGVRPQTAGSDRASAEGDEPCSEANEAAPAAEKNSPDECVQRTPRVQRIKIEG